MAVYEGNQQAQEHLLDSARNITQAFLHAPQITGRTVLRTAILTDEDLLPVIEILEEMAKVLGFVKVSADTYRKAYDAGHPPVLLLLGADVTQSELGWDCGACGFKTCGEFNKYAKKKRGVGRIFGGPSCNWKYFDYNVAASWACDAAARFHIENRIEGSSGLISMLLGYLPGCNVINGLPLGPCTDIWYYNRPAFQAEYEYWKQLVCTSIPQAVQPFAGTGVPMVKVEPEWWKHRRYIKVEDVPEYEAAGAQVQQNVGAVVAKHMEKVQANIKKLEGERMKKLD